ncbi:hypothetical protein VTJ04DRAFT_2700 [Mycothermus thermophilus]|uniref:uncharacterized protein n=1 Tax=Humicola insolens TaxID=85995 RepID=UPI0037425191
MMAGYLVVPEGLNGDMRWACPRVQLDVTEPKERRERKENQNRDRMRFLEMELEAIGFLPQQKAEVVEEQPARQL